MSALLGLEPLGHTYTHTHVHCVSVCVFPEKRLFTYYLIYVCVLWHLREGQRTLCRSLFSFQCVGSGDINTRLKSKFL